MLGMKFERDGDCALIHTITHRDTQHFTSEKVIDLAWSPLRAFLPLPPLHSQPYTASRIAETWPR